MVRKIAGDSDRKRDKQSQTVADVAAERGKEGRETDRGTK
jgi:hypothetical protein